MILGAIVAIIAASVIIYFASTRLGDALHIIGGRFRMPGSVRGATFDAIASSSPEFVSSVIAALLFLSFDVGVGVIVGSALFNILVIPGVLAWRSKDGVKLDPKAVLRDGIWYILVVLALMFALASPTLAWWIGGILVLAYVLYLLHLYVVWLGDRTIDQNQQEPDDRTWGGLMFTVVWTLVFVVGGTYLLLEFGVNDLADSLNIKGFFVAVIIAAAATSLPDVILSMRSQDKGDDAGGISNAFGSNVFDILIGIGLPVFIIGLSKPIHIDLAAEWDTLVFLLFGSMFAIGWIAMRKGLRKSDGALFLGIYGLFVAYVAMKAFVFPAFLG